MIISNYKMNLLKNHYEKVSKAILGKHILKSTPQNLRIEKWINSFSNCVNNGGWHFSYLMSKERIRYKIKSFSHTEYAKEEFMSLKKIEDKIRNDKDLFGRENEDLYYESNLSFLPDIVKNNIDDYRNLIEFR